MEQIVLRRVFQGVKGREGDYGEGMYAEGAYVTLLRMTDVALHGSWQRCIQYSIFNMSFFFKKKSLF